MDGFSTTEPGAARFGNFPDYYRFNPSNKRLKLITDISLDDINSIKRHGDITVLDIGCNTGVRKYIKVRSVQGSV